jgi:hypothetical protein
MECSVCYERLSAPLRLRCGHSYCKACIEEWYISSPAEAPSCPSCRRPIVLKTLAEAREQRLEDNLFNEVLEQYLADWHEFCQDFIPDDFDNQLFFEDLANAQKTIKALWPLVDSDEILDLVECEEWIPWKVLDTRKPWIYWDPPKPYFNKKNSMINRQQQHIKIPPPM